jgi:magnesium chelatase subunit I
LKLALCLTAIDPKIGGVLIEGPRGMAKSTLARGLADLLASGQFVTLPLGATEERLVGTLDLDAALSEGRAQFSPACWPRLTVACYVDEVNLLPDHLVDLLLDVAASGTNLVERDGISHRHSARSC